MDTNSKIIRLECENVKRLKAIEISPDGNMVIIGGQNAQGKSSVLDSIEYCLRGGKSLPPRTLRDGQDKGYVVIETEHLVIKRTFTAAGNSSLVVCNRQNNLKLNSPQAILDKLAGELTFDPLGFSRMKPVEQKKILQKLLGLDFTEVDSKRANLYAERTMAAREEKNLNSRFASAPYHADAPEKEESASKLAEKLKVMQESNNCRSNLEIEMGGMAEELAEMEAELAELTQRIKTGEEELAKKKKMLDEAIVYDTSEVTSKLSAIDMLNAKVRANKEHDKLKDELDKKHGEVIALNEAIESIDIDKADTIARAEMPIAGLAFDDNGVTFNGVPFEQCSSAEQLKVSCAMGISLAPELKIMLIRDGSLLDESSLRVVREMAEKSGSQVWMEVVRTGGDVNVVIEDGSVKGE